MRLRADRSLSSALHPFSADRYLRVIAGAAPVADPAPSAVSPGACDLAAAVASDAASAVMLQASFRVAASSPLAPPWANRMLSQDGEHDDDRSNEQPAHRSARPLNDSSALAACRARSFRRAIHAAIAGATLRRMYLRRAIEFLFLGTATPHPGVG